MVGNKKIVILLYTLLLLLLGGVSGYAAPFKHLKLTVGQSNGDSLVVYASGDEYYNWLHDNEGYTILLGGDGLYYYAMESIDGLVASRYRVDQTDPQTMNVERWLKRVTVKNIPQQVAARNVQNTKRSRMATNVSHKKRLNNIVIFISFNDDSEFATPRSVYNTRFNDVDGPSLYHYYQEVSYRKLDITSSYFPVCNENTNLSYKDSKNRSYYMTNQGGNTNGYAPDNEFEKLLREHALLQRAVNALKPQIESSFTAAQLDGDGDGNVDNICFVIKGNSEGWGGLLWAHRWVLYSLDVRLHNKRVYDYVFQPENQVDVRTLCHEMFHTLGSPDLYHYSYDGFTPVGIWDLMEDSDAHMGAYMKWKYGGQDWISEIPEIGCSGNYTLRPLSDSVNNCYKIPLAGVGNEFLVLEYRQKKGLYESTLPESGLLIYRINPNVKDGNRNGPPDEVYIYRPGGTLTNDGSIFNAAFSANQGRTEFSVLTDPYPFKANGSPIDVSISNIGTTDTTITFTVNGLNCGNTVVDSSLIYRPDTVCQGSFARLSIDMVDKIGPCTYLWEPYPSGSFIIQNAQSATAYVPTTNLAPGTYWLEVTVTDEGEFPPKVRKDTVGFYVRGRPIFSIKPQEGNYCMTQEGSINNTLNIRYDSDVHRGCAQQWEQTFINQGWILTEPTRVCQYFPQEELRKFYCSRFNCNSSFLYENITLSTENGVIGGKAPYRFSWSRCDNQFNENSVNMPAEICATFRNPITGQYITPRASHEGCGYILIRGENTLSYIVSRDTEQAQANITPGCNCFRLTVSDAYGCSSTEQINPVGHHFTSKTVRIESGPLICGQPVILSAHSQCAGSRCSDCGKKCNTDEGANIIWGPANVVTGTGNNATTIPLWQKEKIWTIFVDPITGCRDTVFTTLNINCTDPTTVVIKLEDASFCSSDLPAIITASMLGVKGPCTYEWRTTWDNPIITTSPSLTIPSGVKNCHTVSVFVTDNGYSPAKTAGSSAEICINQSPETFTLSASRTKVCLGDTVTLRASNYGSVAFYKWEAAGGIVTDNWDGTAIGQVLSVPCTFTLTASDRGADAQKCKKSASINITAHIVNAQIKQIDGFACGNMQGTLSAEASSCSQRDNIVSYEWGPPGAIDGVSTNSTAKTKLAGVTTTFYVNVKDESGCSGHNELTVSNNICDVTIFGDTLCLYDGLANTKSVARPFVIVKGGNPSYLWKSTQLSVSGASTATPGFNIYGQAAGDYPVTVDIKDGITTKTYSTIVRLLAPPTVDIQITDSVVCVGEEIKFSSTVYPANTPYKYYWLNGANGPEQGTTATAVMGAPGKNQYTLKIENKYGCFNTDKVSITALAHAFPCATSTCTGSSVYETNIEILGGQLPYTFYSDAALTTPVTDIVWNAAKNNATISNLNSGEVYSFFLDGVNLCKTEEVQVFQMCECNVGAFLSSDNDSISCANPKDTIHVYVNTWGATYYSFDLIAPDGTKVLSVDREQGQRWTYPAIFPNEGTYTLSNFKGYSDTEDINGCEGKVYEDASIYFLRKPTFTLSVNPAEVCVGDTVTLRSQGIHPDFTLEWSTSQGSSIHHPKQQTTTACIASPENTFTLTVKDKYNCTTVQQVQVKGHKINVGGIVSNPALGFDCNTTGTLTLPTAICSQTNCPLSYEWSPKNLLQSTNTPTVSTRPLSEPTRFTVTVTDGIGCRDSAEIRINTGICEVKISGDTLCMYRNNTPDSLAFPVAQIKGGYSQMTWRDLSSAGLVFKEPSSTSPSVNISKLAAGSYPIELSITDIFTTKRYTTTIVIMDNPKAKIQTDITTACTGESIPLTVHATPQSGTYTYYWLHGADGKENSNTATAVVSRTGKNQYIVKIENAYSCSTYDTVTIHGLKEAYLCATTLCTDENTYQTQIRVLGGVAPYELFGNPQLTAPANGSWSNNVYTITGLTSGTTYNYYLSGANLCHPAEIEVVKACGCAPITVCNAGLYLEAESQNCNTPTDSVRIHLQAWGATTYSFQLVAPDGSVVFSVNEENKTAWTWASLTAQAGEYTVEGFTGHVLGDEDCPGKIFGNAYITLPENIIIDAGEDKFICQGETVTLTASGNACSLTWNQGIVNNQPFTPVSDGVYIVKGVGLSGCTVTDTVRVVISDPVEIIRQSGDIVIEKGLNATFFIEAKPLQQTSFIWQHQSQQQWYTLTDNNNTPRISGSSTVRLVVENIPSDWNQTQLRCIARNHCGADTAYFNITVTGCISGGSSTLQMEKGITLDEIAGDAIDGWYCRGTRIGVRALVSDIEKNQKLTYRWTVDGIPVDYSNTEYISWIPAMWEDDIILKVCVYCPSHCDPICAKYLRLKSKAFDNPAMKIVTSIDPRRTFCPGEIVHLATTSKNLGEHPEYHWYNDIFYLGDGSVKTVPMKDVDSWFRLVVKVSDEVCTLNRTLEDTIWLRQGELTTPSLDIIIQPNDSLICINEEITLNAQHTYAGIAPHISWKSDVWNLGSGASKQIRITGKDTWIHCLLVPSSDVCSSLDTIHAYKKINILSDIPVVTIASDMHTKHLGETVTFNASLSYPIAHAEYHWLINNRKTITHSPLFTASNLYPGDKINCLVSGNKPCLKNIASNTLEVKFAGKSRDTLLVITKNETLSNISLFQSGDETGYFQIETHATHGVANLSTKGVFRYTPHKDFVGGDLVAYTLRNPKSNAPLASGTIYITVSDNEQFQIPNIITPNGDGINDTWVLEFLKKYPKHTVSIYNRSGNLVYFSQNYNDEFYGIDQINGKILVNDIYTYVIKLENGMKFISWLEIRRDTYR